MVVGGYALHLYCDDPQHVTRHEYQHRSQFEEPTKTLCMRLARNAGWRIHLGKAICPDCKCRKSTQRKGGGT